VGAMTEGDLEKVLARIAIQYLPKKGEVRQQVKELAESYVTFSLFGSTILDNAGRPVAYIGPIKHDLDGHVIRQTGQNLSFAAVFLEMVIDALREKFKPTTADIAAFLYQSEVFVPEKRPIVEAGITAYLNDDCLTATHLSSLRLKTRSETW